MKLLILGKSRHGKDEVASLLSDKLGLKFKSSSLAALDAIFPVLQEMYNYDSRDEAFDDRNNGNTPMVWKSLITLYNTPDKTSLCRGILETSDMYVGMRCHVEFRECRDLFDHIIWVDAGMRVEDIESNSMSICFQSNQMLILNNNGTLVDLDNAVDDLIDKMALLTATKVDAQPKKEESIRDLIVNWADKQFPDRTITNAIQKMMLEEIPEYLMNQTDAMELADLGILLYDIANLANVDLDQAIRKKMAINKKRKWKVDNITGLMSHVK